jgi:hypothetical protein
MNGELLWYRVRVPRSLALTCVLLLVACGPGRVEDATSGDGNGDSTGDGDGDDDAGTSGDGDGDTSGDGDGDGEGDGDGDSAGDGDGEPMPELCELDPYFETLMAQKLGLESGPISVELAETLTQLSAYSSGAGPGEYPTSLEGIGCAANLLRLRVPPGVVDDLGPVAQLEQLSTLHISSNEVTDLEPLIGNTALRWLGVPDNPVGDGALTILADLELERLYIGGTQITGLDEVLLFEELLLLSIGGLPIADLSPLIATNIRGLYVSGTPVSDLTPLISFAELSCLDVTDTPVTDLSPLLEVNWVVDVNLCNSSCPQLHVSEESVDDFSKNVVIPMLCDMGVDVNNCLSCPQ